jgi:hypothetical protein
MTSKIWPLASGAIVSAALICSVPAGAENTAAIAAKTSHVMPQGVQATRGTALGLSTSDMTQLLDAAVAPPSQSDAYAFQLSSIDKRSVVSVEARGGTKTILLSSSSSGATSQRWTVTSQTTKVELQRIVETLSLAVDRPARALNGKAVAAARKR